MPERHCTSCIEHFSAILSLTCLAPITQFNAVAKISRGMHNFSHACGERSIKGLKLTRRTDNDHLNVSRHGVAIAKALVLLRAFVKTMLFVVVDASINGWTS